MTSTQFRVKSIYKDTMDQFRAAVRNRNITWIQADTFDGYECIFQNISPKGKETLIGIASSLEGMTWE